MRAIRRLEICEVFDDYMYAPASSRNYDVHDGWYPLIGLEGSFDIKESTVLFCKLQEPIEAEAREFCLNGVISKLRIHRSDRVNGPDTMLVLASDLMHEFEVCRVPILATAKAFSERLSGAGRA